MSACTVSSSPISARMVESHMQLAKAALDVGLYTNELDAMLAFWQEQARVPYVELLKVGGGLHQHRHAIGESVLKINHPRDPVATAPPSGISRLEIYSPAVEEPIELLDPDHNALVLLPEENRNRNLNLVLTVNDLTQSGDFYGDVLGLAGDIDSGFKVGASRICLTPGQVESVERQAVGYRYMTVQVFDVVETHKNIISRGGQEGMAPVRLGDVAYISFVRDPDGNWIEISQRKSITGSLD